MTAGGVGAGGSAQASAGTAAAGGAVSGGAAGTSSAGAAGSAGASAGMPSNPDTPRTPPFGWVGIIGTGQSLAVGGGGTEQQQPISKTPSGKNLKLTDTGADPKYPIMANVGAPKWAAIPLSEPIRVDVPGQGAGYTDWQYPNNIQGETPHSAMASTLTALFGARGGMGDYISVHSVVGWAGRCLKDINKSGGQRAYPASLNETRIWKELAQTTGVSFGVGGIIFTHGECDANTADYASGLYQFWMDYNTDLKAITGQARDVVLLGTQQSASSSGAAGSAVQLWQASVAHPQQIICVGPKYQYQYGPDLLHLPAPGYVRLGEKYAEVFEIVVNQGRAWKPLQPTKITRSGATISIDFDVPNPPLLWDAALAAPHSQVNKQWAAGKGFEVKDAKGNPLTIGNAAIDGTRVVLTLAADPGAGKVHVGYALTQDGSGSRAGTVDGLRGLLRDSDEFAGSDQEDIDTDVTQGSAQIKSATPGGFVRRTSQDVLAGSGVAAGTVVLSRDSNDQLTLAAPWSGPSGRIKISYHHGQANFCVHFSMDEG